MLQQRSAFGLECGLAGDAIERVIKLNLINPEETAFCFVLKEFTVL